MTSPQVWTSSAKFITLLLVAALFVSAYWIGVTGFLTTDTNTLIRPIALNVIVPVVLFLATYMISERFRNFVLAQDYVALTMFQHFRVLGFTFLILYSFDKLPALFAWPAGYGDIAVGFAAPFVVLSLLRDPNYAHSNSFLMFHILGMLDFLAAVSTAFLASGVYPELIPEGITSGPMEVWPLNLFPSFFVPILIILHLAVFLKLYHERAHVRRVVEV